MPLIFDMPVFRRIIIAAVLSGSIAGLFVTAIHTLAVVPLIREAEVYEHNAASPRADRDQPAARAHEPSSVTGASHEPAARDDETSPPPLLDTAIANVLTGIGFGLLVSAGIALQSRSTWRIDLLWGAAGYLTFIVAPAIGLPPELPGSEGAPLIARQFWWFATVIATGGGLALVLLRREWQLRALGVLLIVLPHVIGAPHPAGGLSTVPPALETRFIIVVLGTELLFWLVLAVVVGALQRRLSTATLLRREFG